MIRKDGRDSIQVTFTYSLQVVSGDGRKVGAPASLSVTPKPQNAKDIEKVVSALSSSNVLHGQSERPPIEYNQFYEAAKAQHGIVQTANNAEDAAQAAKDAYKKAKYTREVANAQQAYLMDSQPLEGDEATSPPASPAHTVLTFHTSQPTTQEKEKKKEKKNKKKNRKKARKSDSRKSDSSSSDSSSEEDSEADSSSDSALLNEQKGKKRDRPELSEGKANNKKQRSSLTSGGSFEDLSEGSNKTEKKSGWQWFKY